MRSVCFDNADVADCDLIGGVFLGHGLSCRDDVDGDGFYGCGDLCPRDPQKLEPGVCGCGVADTDEDGDAVPDCIDLCPGTPEGAPVDEDGCPLVGACCFPVGACFDGTIEGECRLVAGAYQGHHSLCALGCEFGFDGDFNADGAIDLLDISAFQACAGGPDIIPLGSCEDIFDLDGDGDVDLLDSGLVQVAFGEP